jgi:hypothetical protein
MNHSIGTGIFCIARPSARSTIRSSLYEREPVGAPRGTVAAVLA